MVDGNTLILALLVLALGFLVSLRTRSSTRRRGISGHGNTAPNPPRDTGAPQPRLVKCLRCGTKLRVRLLHLSNIERCPGCGFQFMVVLWDSDNNLYMSGLDDGQEEEGHHHPSADRLAHYLEVLGVNGVTDPGHVSVSEIRKRYYRAVQKYHPDKYVGLPPEFRAVAEKKTRELNEAYACLIRHKKS
jgi:DNA-directed RNA polymerase subunit RPC12/RpoP